MNTFGLMEFSLGKRHKEPLLKNITTTRFPYIEHIDTLSDKFDNVDDFLADLKKPTQEEDDKAFWVGLGVVTAVIIFVLYLIKFS